ncbi:MAG: hypothetical protein WDO19_11430 [Bacteroidota bacterium]
MKERLPMNSFFGRLKTMKPRYRQQRRFFPGGNGAFTIVTLTDARLIVSQDITVSGVTQNAVITLKH